MALRMITFNCSNPHCKHVFEELVEAKDGIAVEKVDCPECSTRAKMDMDISVRVHRKGNRYRDVSWSTWAVS